MEYSVHAYIYSFFFFMYRLKAKFSGQLVGQDIM